MPQKRVKAYCIHWRTRIKCFILNRFYVKHQGNDQWIQTLNIQSTFSQ